MRRWTTKSLAVLAVAIFGLLGAMAAQAQYAPPPPQQGGPYPPSAYPYPPQNGYPPPPQNGQVPGYPGGPGAPDGSQQTGDNDAGAARLSFIHGDVSTQRGDTGEASAATLNTPLMAGDRISTGDSSRTEVQLDFANILRLESDAEANITSLSRAAIQIQLPQGLAEYSVLKGSEASVEIDTPNVSIHPTREGRYRISVSADGETDITVRDGEADVSTAQGSTQVSKGQLIAVRGTGADTQYKTTGAPGDDEWDTWTHDRDNIILGAASRQQAGPYYTGTQDLDQNGAWSEVPDYGQVWYPNVAPDWAPYRVGRWVWEPYWGWTWVSSEPWGWAPYHYGRWFVYGGRWGWWPGPAYVGYRPIWAPAYVSFFGFAAGGVGVGFGFGFGSVGWLPIGPGDYFHPWWGGFRDRFTGVGFGVNAFNAHSGIAPLHGGASFSNLSGVASNERLRAAVSTSSAGNFGRANSAFGRGIGENDLRGARMMTGGLPVSPTRESMRASDRPASAASASAFRGSAQQRFFSTRGNAAGRTFQAQGGGSASGFERSNGFASGANSRPPLNMSKPVVNPNTAYRGAPSNRQAPSYRPSAPAPSYHPSAPAPRASGGGGGSRGGGSHSGGGGHGGHR